MRLISVRNVVKAWLLLAGVCGVLAPLFFTLGVFVLWTVAAGIAMTVAARRRPASTAVEPAASLV